MYIATIPNRNSPPAILLRESYRENGKVKSRTLANLSRLPAESIEILRRSLKGEQLAPVTETFEVLASSHHGHVHAVMLALQRLGLARCLDSRPSRNRDLVVAMIIARILAPNSKLATTRWWQDTTLPSILGIEDADEGELYGALDWLLQRQERIEQKLAARHLENDGLALYDLSSSYFEGVTCPLAAFGHNRDRKKGKLQVNYGLLTNARGIPVAVSVFEGNTGDPKTLLPQVSRMRERFAIERFVLVGDRGMITQKQVMCCTPWRVSIGSLLCALGRFAACWMPRSCRWTCSMSVICSNSATRTSPENGWWLAAIENWPSAALRNAAACLRPPSRSWIRCARWLHADACRAKTRSACAWAR